MPKNQPILYFRVALVLHRFDSYPATLSNCALLKIDGQTAERAFGKTVMPKPKWIAAEAEVRLMRLCAFVVRCDVPRLVRQALADACEWHLVLQSAGTSGPFGERLIVPSGPRTSRPLRSVLASVCSERFACNLLGDLINVMPRRRHSGFLGRNFEVWVKRSGYRCDSHRAWRHTRRRVDKGLMCEGEA
jgi:hypothetical protein